MAAIRSLVVSSRDDLIATLYQTPSPTGEALGRALDAWKDWCEEFDANKDKPIDNAYTL